jgi:hypothetical protein
MVTPKSPAEAVERLLFAAEGERVYAVIDGASVANLLDRLVSDTPPNVCLYRGDLEPDMAEVAPYLVQLEPDSPFTEWLLRDGWGNHWGIFAQTGVALEDLRRHFRRFLIVHDPDSEPMYFRYYDPRVLRVFLPTCNAEELTAMFGPVSCYLMEDEDPAQCLQFSMKDGALAVQKHGLGGGKES